MIDSRSNICQGCGSEEKTRNLWLFSVPLSGRKNRIMLCKHCIPPEVFKVLDKYFPKNWKQNVR